MEIFDALFAKLVKRKIVFYGAEATGARLLIEAEKRNVKIAYLVDRDERKHGTTLLGIDVRSPYDLLREDPKNIYIVITAPGGRDSIAAVLRDMGFSLDDNVIFDYVDNYNDYSKYQNDYFGGTSRGVNTIKPMREERPQDKVLLTLGGSTTDPDYLGIHSWSYYLRELLDEHSKNVRVLCGGVMGYTSSDELLLFLRDGADVRPDYVIDYSGYNDVTPAGDINTDGGYAYVNRNAWVNSEGLINEYKRSGKEYKPMYYGELIKDRTELFLKNKSYMAALCGVHKAKYRSFLQPSMCSIDKRAGGIADRLMHEPAYRLLNDNWNLLYDAYQKSKQLYPFIVDFTKSIGEDVFIDPCHVNEEGNKLIAREMFDYFEKIKFFD